MERETDLRNLERKEKEINVWMYKNNSLIALGYAKNISSEGMFIDTNALIFPKNYEFEIVFEIKEDGKVKRCQIPAKVMHRSLKGIGIKFLNLTSADTECFPSNIRLVNS